MSRTAHCTSVGHTNTRHTPCFSTLCFVQRGTLPVTVSLTISATKPHAVEPTSTEQTSTEQTSTEQTSTEQTSTEQASTEQASAEWTSSAWTSAAQSVTRTLFSTTSSPAATASTTGGSSTTAEPVERLTGQSLKTATLLPFPLSLCRSCVEGSIHCLPTTRTCALLSI